VSCVICGAVLSADKKLVCKVCFQTKTLLFAAMLSLDEIEEGQQEYEEDYVQQVLRASNKGRRTD
jgi:hypothetical protein